MRFATILAVFALVSVSAWAAKWQRVVSTDEYELFVDVDSLVLSGGKVKAWSKWVYQKPVAADNTSSPKSFQSILSLSAYNCAYRSFNDLQAIAYADKEAQRVVRENTYPDDPARYQSVVPGSTGEQVFFFVCKLSVRPSEQAYQAATPLAPASVSEGRFSPWHWIVALLVILNLATIVHIAVSNRTQSWRKAIWVIAALLIPFLPYAAWLVVRPSRSDAGASR